MLWLMISRDLFHYCLFYVKFCKRNNQHWIGRVIKSNNSNPVEVSLLPDLVEVKSLKPIVSTSFRFWLFEHSIPETNRSGFESSQVKPNNRGNYLMLFILSPDFLSGQTREWIDSNFSDSTFFSSSESLPTSSSTCFWCYPYPNLNYLKYQNILFKPT